MIPIPNPFTPQIDGQQLIPQNRVAQLNTGVNPGSFYSASLPNPDQMLANNLMNVLVALASQIRTPNNNNIESREFDVNRKLNNTITVPQLEDKHGNR